MNIEIFIPWSEVVDSKKQFCFEAIAFDSISLNIPTRKKNINSYIFLI